MDDDFTLCWCGHTKIQHGIFGPRLCNFCSDCTGFRVDSKVNQDEEEYEGDDRED